MFLVGKEWLQATSYVAEHTLRAKALDLAAKDEGHGGTRIRGKRINFKFCVLQLLESIEQLEKWEDISSEQVLFT